MKFAKMVLATVICAAFQGGAQAAVSAEEAKQLGANLTLFGSEKAANKDGSIPAYTGGLPTTTAPAGFVPNSGRWADPFASEKPLYSITADNVAKYADKLSEGMQEFIKRTPGFRVDVYPTHRSVNLPKYVLDNTVANATRAKTSNNNLVLEGAIGGIPFPIPKNGYEAMWNHLLRYAGAGQDYYARNWYVDANGKQIMAGDFHYSASWPYYHEGATAEDLKNAGGWYFKVAYNFVGPARNVGDCTLFMDNMDPIEQPRRAWGYSASTRRVRLSPDVAYDTPIATTGGVKTYDDAELFLGKMDRFDFKLVGKREVLLPYNAYKAQFFEKPDTLMGPKFVNPDAVRWELHRVWVVEAKLKPEFRHTYSKRVFYLDEDWSGAGLTEMWDGSGKLFRWGAQSMVQLYDAQVPVAKFSFQYDMSTGLYSLSQEMSEGKTGIYPKGPLPQNLFKPDALAARSGR
ncbi:MAG: DUF1329 domain-containing protein [Rhodocyclaceae bacterium]|jgi:hypothetical protein|nr:DUF1329 domain-containing protein [Rhodocyclaceae bacterium]